MSMHTKHSKIVAANLAVKNKGLEIRHFSRSGIFHVYYGGSRLATFGRMDAAIAELKRLDQVYTTKFAALCG